MQPSIFLREEDLQNLEILFVLAYAQLRRDENKDVEDISKRLQLVVELVDADNETTKARAHRKVERKSIVVAKRKVANSRLLQEAANLVLGPVGAVPNARLRTVGRHGRCGKGTWMIVPVYSSIELERRELGRICELPQARRTRRGTGY